MEVYAYNTLRRTSEGLYKEKGSKFLAFSYQVDNKDAIDGILTVLRKTYYDARHHCYAYILGYGNLIEQRANDDGEPKHSAGDPILGQIKSFELTNTLIVVVRYFGGTKLGVSGLINAYKTAAMESIKANSIVTKYIKVTVELQFPYASTNEVMKLINDFQIEIEEQKFAEDCLVIGSLKIDRIEDFKAKSVLLQQTGTALKMTVST
jgi:uncharacterized YigZ family protein